MGWLRDFLDFMVNGSQPLPTEVATKKEQLLGADRKLTCQAYRTSERRICRQWEAWCAPLAERAPLCVFPNLRPYRD